MDISGRLIKVREDKNYTVEALAKELSVDVDQVNNWEKGVSTPNADMLIRLSKLYSMSIDEILYSENEIPEYNVNKAVYYNYEEAMKNKNKIAKQAKMAKQGKASMILFPALLLIVYLGLGFFTGLWHPGWIILLAIPAYYIFVFLLNKLGDNVDDAVDEFITTNEAEKKNK